jgi:hypothetical protein
MNDKTRDNLLYLGIAIGIVAIAAFPIFYAVSQGKDIPVFPLKSVWLVFSTVVLTAFLVQNLIKRRLKFWRALLLALSVAIMHVVITKIISDRVDRLAGGAPFRAVGKGCGF